MDFEKIYKGKIMMRCSRWKIIRISFLALNLFLQVGLIFVSSTSAAISDGLTLRIRCDGIPPASITDLVASPGMGVGEIALAWTTPGDDEWNGHLPDHPYKVKYDTRSVAELGGTTTSWWNLAANEWPQAWDALNPGEWDDDPSLHYLAGLTTGTIYYIAIRAIDKVGNEALNNNVASAMPKVEDETAPAAIIDLVATPGAGYDRIDLSWTAPGDDEWVGMATKYIIKYATYNITIDNFDSVVDVKERNVTVSGGNPDSQTITGLASDTLYYFAIKTEDEVPNVSGISNIATAIIVEDTLPPRQPAGIKGILSADGKTMTISWSGVSKDEDGTACEDLSGYNIYRASVVDGEYTLVDSVAQGESLVWTDPEDIKGRTFYYMVRAKDTANNLSKISMIADSSKDMNIIAVNSEEMSTRMVIPKEIKQILYKENNSYGDDVIIEVLRNKEEENGRVIKFYSFIATRGQSGKEIKDFVFASPLARIVLAYEVENGHVKGGSSVPEDRASERLALFWFNGLEWIKLGGEVDEGLHLVSIRSKRIGKYKIKESLRASSFVIESIQPDKTFTPNGDGWNDYFEIKYANPKKGSVSGKIYDLRGALVAGMGKGASDKTLMWDGRDASGNPAPGGVYIYQIQVTGPENKVINGTVVVAR